MTTFLLLHGGGGTRTVAGFGELLAKYGPVKLPTHPGFAGTPRPAEIDSARALAARYLAELTEDVVVIGNSLGGWIAAEMAIASTGRVRGAVLVNAVGFAIPGEPITDVAALPPGELPKYSFHKPPVLPPDAPRPQPEYAALAVYGGKTMNDPTLLDRASKIRVPVNVLWGESDRIATPAYGRAVAAAIPNATFTLLPESGHLPLLETPERALDQILAWLRARELI
jgi:pimeloyl-ACP methyl ester carboxylesterase